MNTKQEYEITAQNNTRLIYELKSYKELFYFFTWRDIKIKYKQTFLGFAWAVLQPLFMSFLFTIFLGEVISNKIDLNIPYAVFVLSGMVLWNVFSNGLSGAANSMVANANIIKKIYFPRLIIPISSVLVALFDFLMAFIVLLLFMIYHKVFFQTEAFIYIPLSILITLFSALGFGTFLSALNIKYRDFRYVIPFFIQSMLFITPVIYPTNITSNKVLSFVLSLNPMSSAIELFRASFMKSHEFNTNFYLSVLIALIVFIYGIYYFRKTEYYFADLA